MKLYILLLKRNNNTWCKKRKKYMRISMQMIKLPFCMPFCMHRWFYYRIWIYLHANILVKNDKNSNAHVVTMVNGELRRQVWHGHCYWILLLVHWVRLVVAGASCVFLLNMLKVHHVGLTKHFIALGTQLLYNYLRCLHPGLASCAYGHLKRLAYSQH